MKTLRSSRLVVLAVLLCTPLFGRLAHAESPADAALRTRTKAKISSIFKSMTSAPRIQLTADQRQKMGDAMKGMTPGQPPSPGQMAAMRKKMEAIMTPQQRKEMADQRAKTMKVGEQTLSWISTELKLTSAQKSKVRAMLSESAEPRMGGRMGGPGGGGPGGPGGRPSGGPGGGPGGGRTGGMRMGGGRMGGLGTFFGRRDRLGEVLTPAQKPKWEIMKSAAREAITSQFGGRMGGPGGGGGRPGGRMGGPGGRPRA